MKRNLLPNFLLLSFLNSFALVASDSLTAIRARTVTNSISIDALVADVLESNPELNFYTAEISAAKGERQTALTRANPELSAQAGRKSVRAGGLSDEGAAWSVSVQQPLEWPGRIPLRKAIANQQIKLAELGYAQFKKTLAAKARAAAYNLFADEEKETCAREVAERLQSLREVLVQRDPAGLTPTLELRIIESIELTLQRKVTEQSLAMNAALLELNQLRGQPWEALLRVLVPDFAFTPPPPSAELLEAARTNNFELQMRKAELEQQGFKVSLARNERYPTVSVGPFFSHERAADAESIVGISISIPVPLWNRNKGNIEVSKARELQAQTSLYLTQRDLERKIMEQLWRYQTKLGEMSKWRPDSVEQFRDAAALADRHYRLGSVPVTTYVELQKQYLEAVETLLDTKREAWEAREQLQVLIGMDFNASKISAPREKSTP